MDKPFPEKHPQPDADGVFAGVPGAELDAWLQLAGKEGFLDFPADSASGTALALPAASAASGKCGNSHGAGEQNVCREPAEGDKTTGPRDLETNPPPAMSPARHSAAADSRRPAPDSTGNSSESMSGREVAGFRLVRQIGRGGGGVVYEAIQQAPVVRRVAIKFLNRRIHEHATKWEAEPRALAALQHPNLVSVVDSGLTSDGIPWLAMLFVDGQRADEWVQARQASPGEIARLMLQVARGIGYAHRQGILHRDLKPGNILVQPDGTPVVTDFGLAKQTLGSARDSLTESGLILGSPGYLAPEQVCTSALTNAGTVDVWGIGATLYRLLTGVTPSRDDNWAVCMDDLLRREPTPVRKLNPRVSRDLEAVCLKCLEKAPEDRYASLPEVIDELERVCNGQPVRARPISRFRKAVRWARREPVTAGLLALLVGGLLMTTVVFGWLWQSSRDGWNRTGKNLELALANIRREHELAEEMLPPLVGSMDYRIRRLEETIRFHEALLQANPGDDMTRYRLHVNQFLLAQLLPNRDRLQEALEVANQALQGFEEFHRRFPHQPGYLFDVFHALRQRGTIRGAIKEFDYLPDFAEALTAIEKLNRISPGVPEYEDAFATALVCGCFRFNGSGKMEKGKDNQAVREMADRGARIAQQLYNRYPDRPRYLRPTIRAKIHIAQSWRYEYRYDRAEAAIQEAIAAAEHLAELPPKEPDHLVFLIESLVEAARIAFCQGRSQDAEALHQKGMELIRNCERDYPDVLGYRQVREGLEAALEELEQELATEPETGNGAGSLRPE